MKVTLLGIGGGSPGGMTAEADAALARADLIIGAQRLLDTLPEREDCRVYASVRSPEIARRLAEGDAKSACVVFSGDTGFFSGARTLAPLLREMGVEYRLLPGISSVQLLAARLGKPWQDWTIRSAHGADCDPVAAVMGGAPAFFITGGGRTPATLCAELTAAGLGELRVTVGENLSYAEERVMETSAAACVGMSFAPLSVLLCEAAPCPAVPAGGVADEDFVRGGVPMTKQVVRAAIRSALALRRDGTAWDVGAGTGSVSVELALAAREGKVYAIERGDEACALIEENRRKFGAWNLRLVRGEAPESLADLPRPDAVFIGGSGGRLQEIVAAAIHANRDVRLCVSAIAMETLQQACEALSSLQPEITQISVSRTQRAGELSLLKANNPVFLITAGGKRPG